ncbi:cytochrome c, class I [Pseudomaricurvus alcaniphilus]|uniref:cytochrome c, class I n=1 Tax=Pseudomaricurvus alcaniphilus TaxID=1166482 RepID=UPI00140E8175|nr:cytochrome c, class I [Pseudomaricurvus alcaniphilus]NHN36595.1 cytochrome c, class I [Pseudomaricurvus alcaniphilus]
MKGLLRGIALALLTLNCSRLLAEVDLNEARAKFHYQMFCQGCHTRDGMGSDSVPRLKGFIGNFLQSQKGREYLVRVPGSANSTLSNDLLAEVLNWKILTFGEHSIPDQWQPYSGEEVGRYRQHPLQEVLVYREELVDELKVVEATSAE